MARKLSRKFQARERLMRNQLSSLVLNGKVITTLSKAKLLKSEMEKLIQKTGKLEAVSRKRMIGGTLYSGAVKKLDDEYKTYKNVAIYKVYSRRGDGAPMGQVVIGKDEPSKSTSKKIEAKNE